MTGKILPRARVVRREDLTHGLMKMWLQPPDEFQPFKPGQYCTIGVDGVERPYSIVSAPDEPLIELFLDMNGVEQRVVSIFLPLISYQGLSTLLIRSYIYAATKAW